MSVICNITVYVLFCVMGWEISVSSRSLFFCLRLSVFTTANGQQKQVCGNQFTVFLHICLQSLCEDARIVMRGYYLEKKSRPSISLLLSSVRDPHPSRSLSHLLLAVSLFTASFPTIAALENMMQVLHPVQTAEVFWRNGSGFFCFCSPGWAVHPLPTLVQLGLTLEYFRCWLVKNICTATNPLSVFFSFSWSVSVHVMVIER